MTDRDLRTPHPLEVMAKQLAATAGSGIPLTRFQDQLIEEGRRRRRARINAEIQADLNYGRN